MWRYGGILSIWPCISDGGISKVDEVLAGADGTGGLAFIFRLVIVKLEVVRVSGAFDKAGVGGDPGWVSTDEETFAGVVGIVADFNPEDH